MVGTRCGASDLGNPTGTRSTVSPIESKGPTKFFPTSLPKRGFSSEDKSMKIRPEEGLRLLPLLFLSVCLVVPGFSQAKKPPSRQPTTGVSAALTLSVEELKKLQAVLQTSKGDIVIEFFPD